jgi:hypothetical protein
MDARLISADTLMRIPLRYLAGLFALFAFGTAAAATAQADGAVYEIRGGILAHDVPALWSGFRTEEDAVALNLEAIFPSSVSLLGGTIRPAVGASVATGGGTSNAYADLRWMFEAPGGLFFAVGIGATVHDGKTGLVAPNQTDKALGSRVLFHVPAEIGYRFDTHNSLSVYFEHMSNANTAGSNEGLDRLGVRYGYRF